MKVLIVDDDALVGDLSLFLLKDAGFDASLISNSLIAMAAIRENRPALVLLDILMPGIDGLTLCQQIKSDPELRSTKVAMVSAKSFASEKERAMKFGADAFIEKPYNTETFGQKIKDLIGSPTRQAEPLAAPAPAAAMEAPSGEPKVRVRVWGSRAAPETRAAAGPSKYGRGTSCVTAEFAGNLFIFDAGSGLEALGAELNGTHKDHWIFLSHFHADHVSALGSYPAAFTPGHRVYISGANDPEKSLQALVEEAFTKGAAQRPLAAEFQLYEMLEDTYEVLPGVKVGSFYANHPTTTLGFAVEAEGRKLVYCPDGEIYGETATALQDYDEKIGAVCAGADLLIHDGRYTESDYQAHLNEGHSSFINVIDFAARNNVRRLMLFHQDAAYDDAALDRMAEEAQRRVAERGYDLECVLASRGMTLEI